MHLKENHCYGMNNGNFTGPMRRSIYSYFPWTDGVHFWTDGGTANGAPQWCIIKDHGPSSRAEVTSEADDKLSFVIVNDSRHVMTIEEARATVLTQKIVGARICKIVEVASQEISLKPFE